MAHAHDLNGAQIAETFDSSLGKLKVLKDRLMSKKRDEESELEKLRRDYAALQSDIEKLRRDYTGLQLCDGSKITLISTTQPQEGGFGKLQNLEFVGG